MLLYMYHWKILMRKKTYSGCLVMFKQPGSKGGKDQNFMIEYINQTSSEIHINAIVQV